MRINHNMMAMNTHRQLGISTQGGAKSMEKLSSGYRINRAGDDAAGLSISEKMRNQVRGLGRASANAQDGISLIQTAEGALDESHAILKRIRELTIQAGNEGTLEQGDMDAIQDEYNELKEELTGISNRTEFNGKKLLDGSYDGQLQIGANQNQSMELIINSERLINGPEGETPPVDPAKMMRTEGTDGPKVPEDKFETSGNIVFSDGSENHKLSIEDKSGKLESVVLKEGDTETTFEGGVLTIGYNDGEKISDIMDRVRDANELEANDWGFVIGDNPEALDDSKKVQESATSGIEQELSRIEVSEREGTIKLNDTDYTIKSDGKSGVKEIKFVDGADGGNEGFDIGDVDEDGVLTITLAGENASKKTIKDLNEALAAKEISIELAGDDIDTAEIKHDLKLTENIKLDKIAVDEPKVPETKSYEGTMKIGDDEINISVESDKAVSKIGFDVVDGSEVVVGDLDENGELTITVGKDAKLEDIKTKLNEYKDLNIKLDLGDADGEQVISTIEDDLKKGITLTEKEEPKDPEVEKDKDGGIYLPEGSKGGVSAEDLGVHDLEFSLKEMNNEDDEPKADMVRGARGGAVEGETEQGKQVDKNLGKVDNAINIVSKMRSHLGANQNRLEHTISNLDNAAENIQASESRIRDVDMAKEMMEQTRQNILQQASTSMLAQANMAPQSVLQLLG